MPGLLATCAKPMVRLGTVFLARAMFGLCLEAGIVGAWKDLFILVGWPPWEERPNPIRSRESGVDLFGSRMQHRHGLCTAMGDGCKPRTSPSTLPYKARACCR